MYNNTEEELKEITKYFENIFKKEQSIQYQNCDEIRAELLKNSPNIIYEHIAELLN